MESQVSPSGVPVDGRTTWTNAVLASFTPSDHHVSDAEIFEMLNAGGVGEAAGEFCAAKGVTLPMYCVWKTKYRHLSFDDLRKMRRRERWRGRCVLGVLLAAAALGTGGIVLGVARAAQPNITVATGLTPADRPSTPKNVESLKFGPPMPMNLESAKSQQGAATQSAEMPQTASAPGPGDRADDHLPNTALAPAREVTRVAPESRGDTSPSITEPGYKIQVAAAQSLQEGRVFLERLASAGYPAYLSRAIVSNTEVFRVRVGPFDALSVARQIASQLQRDGYNGAWIAQ